MDTKEISQKIRALESQRKVVEQVWQVLERFVLPFNGRFFQQAAGESSIEWRRREVYDATAVQACIQLAASIHGSLTNPSIKWFEMAWRQQETSKNHEAQIWLEQAADRMFQELQDSNFNLEANNSYRSLTGFGTALLTQEPVNDLTDVWGGMVFSNVPLKEAFFTPTADGGCQEFFRRLEWKASQVVSKFGYENVPEKIQQHYDRASDDFFTIVFAVYPRKGTDTSAAILTPRNRPFGWKYIGYEDGHLYDEGGYYEMPAYAPRWAATSESQWGNGPSHYALADILTLNQLVELDIKAREKVIDPALLVQERALINTLNLGPGAQNVVRDISQVKAFESAARFDVVEATIIRLQESVRKYFYIDQLELKESPAMTATEVQVRYELMQRLLSSTMARLKEEFLDPLLQRTFNLLYRAGELGELPQGIELEEFDITYVGPLSRSMRFDESASIERWVTQLQLMAQTGGEAEQVLLVPDWDAIARRAAAQLNLPTELTRDPDDVKADIQATKDAKNRQASADAAGAEAAAAKDLGQAQSLGGGTASLTGVPSV
jgi:hypothetical protein